MARIAVVTGAAGGLGRAISAQLMADGLLVVGLDINAAGLDNMAAEVFISTQK
jgi:NAD(P)-dependent dehydrogenase (short-subunit alcohol dehydrogenase family)